MDFIEELRNLSTRIAKQRDLAAQKEQATRNALVEPFLVLLGYDVQDLTEVRPESDADFVEKKRPKQADYAILKDDVPIMLIECKPYGTNLDNHTSQLQGYFAADDYAQIGIMTDGGLYRFYSDLERPNKMEGEPFLEFDLFDIQEPLVKEVERFTKSKFNLNSIVNAARDLKSRKEIKDILRKELASPTKDFVRFFLSSIYSGTKSQAVVQEFTEIVKQAFNEFISEQQSSQSKPDSGLAAEPDNSSEQLIDNENSNQPRKKTLMFEGNPYELDGYRACLVKCCELLSELNKEDFKKKVLADNFKVLERQEAPYFTTNRKDFRATRKLKGKNIPARKIKGTDIYVWTNFAPETIKDIVDKLAQKFECKASIEE